MSIVIAYILGVLTVLIPVAILTVWAAGFGADADN